MNALIATFKQMTWTARIGLLIILFYTFLALFGPLVAPFGETEIVGSEYDPWSAQHWLGTDALGRDMLSRVIFAARNTIGIALLSTALAFFIGGSLGLIAAALGGWVDGALSRLVDVLMAVPQLICALLLLTIFGTSIANLVFVIALVDATRIFRLARSVSLNVVVTDYMEVARLRGEGLLWLVAMELLPNVRAPLVAEFGLRFCFVFLTISSLSFLGLGLQPPLADWGSMVRENASLISFGDLTPLIPAAAIGVLAIAVNFVADWFLAQRR
ncbi:ABC transporter permease [Pseudomonas sp. PDM23]|uniref:ABC transporter permease n=1 Tax=unclassified Pseudomonas TaxID=196821 RepID=UPI00177DD508|nr:MULTISPECIES: ABC transporter permease [unclassified Pseudomonas]MBD9500566.1 ABC transporter permease [Pseudomonas sp. PDM17]MBD9577750.1 ABC transporter permease [Pseudomonas sp. PDM23]MBD9672310.1 ABC transporter permease [Pseudomonas sp. PDM21]